MNNYAQHQKLLDEILLAVGSMPEVRLWPRHVGCARHLHTGGIIRYGVVGESDLDGILQGGRRLAIEVKSGRGRLSKEQMRWRDMLIKYNALYIEARSVAQVLKEINDALGR